MESKLGIFAGSGELPRILVECCKKSGREIFILGLEGETAEELLSNYPSAKVRIAAIGSIFKILREQNIEEVVLAGKIKRPGFKSMIPDLTGAKLIARITSAKLSGDDALLKLVIGFIEENGFKVSGAHDVAPELITPAGKINKISPDKEVLEDIKQAFKIAQEIGRLDIGQAIIYQAGQVLSVEAAEGTDEMIKRTKHYINGKERSAILVKVCKPDQELRVDMPVIGPETISNCLDANIGGIILEAGRTMMLNKTEIVERANKHSIFITGHAA